MSRQLLFAVGEGLDGMERRERVDSCSRPVAERCVDIRSIATCTAAVSALVVGFVFDRVLVWRRRAHQLKPQALNRYRSIDWFLASLFRSAAAATGLTCSRAGRRGPRLATGRFRATILVSLYLFLF